MNIKPRLTIKFARGDRHYTWFVKRDGVLVSSFGYSFLPPNNGGSFSRNYGRARVGVNVHVVGPDGQQVSVLEGHLGRGYEASYLKHADKTARKFFRDFKVRQFFRQHVLEGRTINDYIGIGRKGKP